jgi:hypothetical protein
VRDDQAKIGELCGQIQANQNALAKTNKQAPKDPNAGKPAMAAQPPPTNNLGTITTQDGRTFQNCRVIKVKTDGIVVSYSEGITEIKYALLPPDLQKKFGFDPRQAAALTQAQLQYQEEQKNAAAQAAGN